MFRDFVNDVVIPIACVVVAVIGIVAVVVGIASLIVESGDGDTTYAVTLPSGETLHGLQLKYDSLESERTRFTTPDGKVLVIKGPHVIVEETQAEREGK